MVHGKKIQCKIPLSEGNIQNAANKLTKTIPPSTKNGNLNPPYYGKTY